MLVNNGAEIQLFTVNDEVTLDYNDRILLRFNPSGNQVENDYEFVRDTAIVNIIDKDSKLICA